MNAKTATLSATLGLLLAAGTAPAGASMISLGNDPMNNGQGRVHSQERNIRYFDSHSRMLDYSGGEHSEPTRELADGVVFEQVSFLQGKTMFTDRFNIDAAGTYEVTLSDFAFPDPLSMAGVNITSATESFGSLLAPGSFTFDAQPGSYYLSFFGKADHLGQFGLQVSQYAALPSGSAVSPVPVPAAAWLFGSGLVGMAGVIRRKNG